MLIVFVSKWPQDGLLSIGEAYKTVQLPQISTESAGSKTDQ